MSRRVPRACSSAWAAEGFSEAGAGAGEGDGEEEDRPSAAIFFRRILDVLGSLDSAYWRRVRVWG